MSHTVEPSRIHAEEARNTHERRTAYFSAGVFILREERYEEDTKLRMPLFFRLCFTALVLHLQRQKSRYKIAGIDYEKHGDGVCFYFGSEDCVREKEREGQTGGLDYGSVTALT